MKYIMSKLLNDVSNSIWHAFSALAICKNGTVSKSKLKVLTANIGSLLEFIDVEKGIDDYRSTADLNFDNYKYYLQRELFSSLPDTLDRKILQDYKNKIEDVCWLVCKKNFLTRDNPVLDSNSVYQLFRIFCLLGELHEEEGDVFQVCMSPEEVEILCSQLVTSLGQPWDHEDFRELVGVIDAFKFPIFLTVIESKYVHNMDEGAVTESISELCAVFVGDVIKKGVLLKKGDIIPTLREYWFVLKPSGLEYFADRGEKDRKGKVTLTLNCRVDSLTKNSPNSKTHRLLLVTDEKMVELGACDRRTKLQWISALKTAILHSTDRESYQRHLAAKRRLSRETEKLKVCEENERRLSQIDIMEQTKAELQAEKVARAAAEEEAKVLAEEKDIETKKLKDLEDIRQQLECLLEEETQAKRDEEIVRNLQARVLREEWEKREELEQLQTEQRRLLDEERKKREAFESRQREKELRLIDAEMKLRALEEDRKRLDRELRAAQEKIMSSGRSKEILETKLRVRERDKCVRTTSFLGLSMKSRPSFIPVRSASMRETRRRSIEDDVNNNSDE